MRRAWPVRTILAAALLSFGASSANAEGQVRDRFMVAINEINAQLGPIDGVKAPPPFQDAANRARYATVNETIADFGTEAFPVDGMKTFEEVCAPINAAAVKHMFVGTSALKNKGLSQADLAQTLSRAMQQNAQTYENEIVRLTAANLNCTTAHLPFLERFVESLPPGEFTPVRRDRLEKMGRGLGNAVFGLASQSLVPGSSPENSRMAMDVALRHAPKVISIASPSYRKLLVAQMAMIEGRIAAPLRSDFVQLKSILNETSCTSLCLRLLAPVEAVPVSPR
jgi:hypothetical protein